MQKYLFSILIVLISVSIQAQTQRKTSEDYLIEMPDSYPSYLGTLTYSYTVNDDGDRVKNGPLSIKGSFDQTIGDGYMSVSIKGNYNLSGACKEDEMNGPFSVAAKYHIVVKKGRTNGAFDEVYTMKGSFVEGLPHGNFTASITDIGTVNVNYSNGLLVRAYAVEAAMMPYSFKSGRNILTPPGYF